MFIDNNIVVTISKCFVDIKGHPSVMFEYCILWLGQYNVCISSLVHALRNTLHEIGLNNGQVCTVTANCVISNNFLLFLVKGMKTAAYSILPLH